MFDDLGSCMESAIGATDVPICARHAFILSETVKLYDRESGIAAIKEQALAYEAAGSL